MSAELSESKEQMTAVEGIGPGVARLVEEFRQTGTIAELDRLDERFPSEVAWMARLPRMTPGRLEALKQGLGVNTVVDLLAAIDSGAVSTIEGIGPATVDRWETILSLPTSPGAVPAHDGAVTASRLRHHLMHHLDGDEVMVAGDVRRLEEWVQRIDLVLVTHEPERAVRFLEDTAAVASSAVEPGWAIDLITHSRIPASVRMADREAAGTALVRWTGPAGHVDDLGLDGDVPYPSEEKVYEAAGRVWIPPPARRGKRIDGADLIKAADIRGDLHLHSTWSPDGHMDIDQIVEAALERAYGYIVLTDHTFGLRFGGLDAGSLRRQRSAVAETRRRYPDLEILHGAEINVDRQGVPDLDDETLGWLDFVVAGCHSDFDLPRSEQTARIIAAVRHPAIKVIAHPLGRRIGIRPGFDLDLEVVFEAAAETKTALEVNGHRDRMDLSALNAAAGLVAGVRLVANSDAHRLSEIDNVSVAVGVLQKAGAEASHVLNTLPYDDLMAWYVD